jgi:FkbM family methyltransferase
MKEAVQSGLKRVNLALCPHDRLVHLSNSARIASKVGRLGMISDAHLRRAIGLLEESQSQLNQDLFVLEQHGWKQGGYFVEFGAGDGKTRSNSWLLEMQFGWQGILAEPARMWRAKLESCGRAAALDFDCVWSKTGEVLDFDETSWGELSTISRFKETGDHDRELARRYQVRTVSLEDLLERHGAPEVMDYLSIDTEGSELAILEAFDFSRRRFRCITVEHNHTPAREAINALLTAHGYRRLFEDLSDFDDWYVLED